MPKTCTFRIVDARQSKKPNYIKKLIWWALLPSAAFWPGVIVDSAPMQWVGFILFIATSTGVFLSIPDEYGTADEARKRIDEIEADQAD